jgi:hypothetical protein
LPVHVSDIILGQSSNRLTPSQTTISTTTTTESTTATTSAAAEMTTTPIPKKQNARQRLRDFLLHDHEPGVHPIDDHEKVGRKANQQIILEIVSSLKI